ncbi:MAG TPA: serine/threonine-protein kinase, partial [Polyangiaceae bacterium]
MAPVKEGDVVAGKYRVDKVLGVGGMGIVVAAHHLQLDERVALKFLLPDALANAEAVARFAREARAAVKIKSEHVARVSDVGTLENGAPYMVMEYLDGKDLSVWLEERGRLPIDQAVDFVLQACEAIAEAHGLGIVHRDLKPANLFVIRRADAQLSVKVLDFGISKMRDLGGSGSDMSMTKTTAVMGSPLYMSPEQMESSRNVDARSDIWALGIILYELITGKLAFLGDTMPELVVKILTTTPAPLRNIRPDAPPGLQEVILKCLEKDRTKRYANVGELARALLEFGSKRARASVERISGTIQASGLSASALALPPSSDRAGEAPRTGTVASWGRSGVSPTPQRTTALVGLGLVAVIGVGIAFYFVKGRGESSRGVEGKPLPAALSETPKTEPSPEPPRAPEAPPPPATTADVAAHPEPPSPTVTPSEPVPPTAAPPRGAVSLRHPAQPAKAIKEVKNAAAV